MPLHLQLVIGENAAWLRPMVAKYLGYLGVELDEAASEKACGVEGIISTPESKVKLCVIPTNEELAIARRNISISKIIDIFAKNIEFK